jgi:hypothetical protein
VLDSKKKSNKTREPTVKQDSKTVFSNLLQAKLPTRNPLWIKKCLHLELHAQNLPANITQLMVANEQHPA